MADNLPAKAGEYGDLKVSGTIGLDDFREHDHSRAWEDQGQAAELGKQIGDLLSSYGAEQAKQGAIEYITGSTGQIRPIQGASCFVLDASNKEVNFGALWKLLLLQLKTIDQAEAAGDSKMLQIMGNEAATVQAKVQEALDRIGGTFQQDEPPAAQRPSRRLPGPGTRVPASNGKAGEQRVAGPRARQPARQPDRRAGPRVQAEPAGVPVIRQNVFGDGPEIDADED